jgi:hypothetical protein
MGGMGTADIGAARLRKSEKSHLPQVDQITDRVGHGFPEAGINLWVSNVTEFPRIRNRSVTCGVQIPPLLRDSNAAAAMREIQRHR